MSIIHSVLDIVIEHADKYSAKRVIKINLEVGELSDIIPHWMQEYFDMLSKDTIAERAELCIEKIPAILKCYECENEFRLTREDWQFYCPECKSTNIQILSGREYKIKSIEVE